MDYLFYRIYDPHKKKWFYNEGTPMNLSEFFKNTAYINTTFNTYYQRYTGKTSVDKSKIYEGDIVVIIPSGNDLMIMKTSKEEVKFEIIWSKQQCGFLLKSINVNDSKKYPMGCKKFNIVGSNPPIDEAATLYYDNK